MDTVEVRPAETRDLRSLRRLLEELHEFHARGVPDRLKRLDEGGYDPSTLLNGLRKIFGDEGAEVFLARVAGRTVGLAEVVLWREEDGSLSVGRAFGYLRSLVVHEPIRAEAWARGSSKPPSGGPRAWAPRRREADPR